MSIESPEKIPELTPERIKQVAELAAEALQKHLQENFAHFPFHNEHHSFIIGYVGEKIAAMILDAQDVSSEQKAFVVSAVKLAGWGHDSVINFSKIEQIGIIQRERGWKTENAGGPGNEYKSFLFTIRQFWTHHLGRSVDEGEVLELHENEKARNAHYKEFMDMVEDGIRATFPEVDMNATYPPETLTTVTDGNETIDLSQYLNGTSAPDVFTGFKISQPYLEKDADDLPRSIVGISIASADILTYGYDPKSTAALKAGMSELLEVNYRCAELLAKPPEIVSNEEVKKIKDSIAGWLRTQVQHALWQKIRAQELFKNPLVPTKAHAGLSAYLGHFDQALVLIDKKYKEFMSVAEAEREKNITEAERVAELRILRSFTEKTYQQIGAYTNSLPQ